MTAVDDEFIEGMMRSGLSVEAPHPSLVVGSKVFIVIVS